MNGEHLYDLRQRDSGHAGDTNGQGMASNDSLQTTLSREWAIGIVLAAYDHVLFHPWRPGDERTWSATLGELMAARGRILSEVIPMRLREYRRDTLRATVPVSVGQKTSVRWG